MQIGNKEKETVQEIDFLSHLCLHIEDSWALWQSP